MRILGVNSILNILGGYKSVLFYDLDNVNISTVNHLIKYLNGIEISISLFKSNVNSYHIVSFQIFELEKISQLQSSIKNFLNERNIETDYLDIYQTLDYFFEGNTLRISDKGDNVGIEYVKTSFADKNHFKYDVSARHIKLYETVGMDEKDILMWKVLHNISDYPIFFVSYETMHNLRNSVEIQN